MRTLFTSSRRACLAFVIAALALCRGPAFAHDGVDEQLAALSARIAQSPSDPALLVRRADLYRAGGHWTEALADLDRAATLDPSATVTELLRAQVHLDAGIWTEASAAATRVLARQRNHQGAFLIRGRARARLGMAREAADDLTRALDTRPLPDIYLERARLLAPLGRDGAAEALAGLDAGIVRLGPVATLELEAIDIEVRLQRYDAALQRVDRLAAQAVRKESWHARRAAILEQAGRRSEARIAYQAALGAATANPRGAHQSRASRALIEEIRASLARLDGGTAASPHVLTRNR
ncbi:MAG: hypothetical protein ABL971_13000 [Vicinamibacterales bacterium]